MVTNSEHEFLMNRSWQVLIVVKLALGIVICLLMRQVIILFYFVGDIDMETFKPLVEKYIGGLPAGKQQLGWKDDGVRVLPGVKEERQEIRMETARSMVSIGYSGGMDYTQQNMMTMGMLSACLQSRYNQIIREEKVEVTGFP